MTRPWQRKLLLPGHTWYRRMRSEEPSASLGSIASRLGGSSRAPPPASLVSIASPRAARMAPSALRKSGDAVRKEVHEV
eukprot:CAMPEP_0180350298 /NCGR_PEP_ID=MMETSP0989-20121125/5924_2 /TAXON_ID=697907 /ORGANISM="non described non described, Strain CCMP2293" /LENGTH=78 /DNA_ID=CAMNT_0022339671 /DNA_START=1528 /DNA_END=1764 /DNA_ORIENTATION=-